MRLFNGRCFLVDPIREKKTIEDLMALPEDTRAELIDGEIVMMAPASRDHSAVQFAISRLATRYSDTYKSDSGDDCWVFAVEAWTKYDKNNVFVHDLAAFKKSNYDHGKTGPIAARPEWVCEVLSPANWIKDTQHLRVMLASFGVPYYWTVDPLRKEIVSYGLKNMANEYSILESVPDGEIVNLEPFSGLVIDTREVFSSL